MRCQDIGYVVLFRDGSCHTAGADGSRRGIGNNSKSWFTSMQLQCWLPFALGDPSLLTALLLQSCHSLDILMGSQSFAGMYTAYKHQCIRSTTESLSLKNTSLSDVTITMVMILLAESVSIPFLETASIVWGGL
jgi:hypothetical protein